MHERIRVPVDGSPYAEEVIPYVLGIAAASGARLTLLRVIEKDSEQDEAARQVQALADALKAEARTVRSRGNIAAAILEEAARVPETLVAITSVVVAACSRPSSAASHSTSCAVAETRCWCIGRVARWRRHASRRSGGEAWRRSGLGSAVR
ncbi:MAG: universal stress protein [Burkholderiaceae bacterium]